MRRIRKDVFLLGAGFSKAVHHGMPLLNELGELAVARLVAGGVLTGDPGPFDDQFTFESWLASLAESQPFLTEAENAKNFAMFAALRDEIVEVLHSAEESFQQSDPPGWLDQLIFAWQGRLASVITFNYDRLIEIEILRRSLIEQVASTPRSIEIADLTNGIPPSPLDPEFLPPQRINAMQLLKLHGSLDWHMAQNDRLGTTLLRSDLQVQNNYAFDISDSERERRFPGREVFIVPPTISKSGYLNNLWIQQIWQDAHRALRHAKRFVVIGYSLSPADITAGALIHEALQRNSPEVIVVDLQADKVSRKLQSLGVSVYKSFGGKHCLQRFVNWYLAECASGLLDTLTPFPDQPTLNPLFSSGLPIVLANCDGFDRAPLARVTKIDIDHSSTTITLIADKVHVNFSNVSSPDFVSDDERCVTLDTLSQAIKPDYQLIALKAGKVTFPVSVEQVYGPTGGGPRAAILKVVAKKIEPATKLLRARLLEL